MKLLNDINVQVIKLGILEVWGGKGTDPEYHDENWGESDDDFVKSIH